MSLQEQEQEQEFSCTGLVIGGFLITITVFALAGFILFSSVCPCGDTPGGFLFGEREQEVVTNWAFVNDSPLCQLQTWRGLRPYSVNIACMADSQGVLYLSCTGCDEMLDTPVSAGKPATVRHNGRVYSVLLSLQEQSSARERLWGVYRELLPTPRNLQQIGGLPGAAPPHSWTLLRAENLL